METEPLFALQHFKQIVSDLMLDKRALKEVVSKKW
jgi:hypothetical protein